MNIQQIHDEAHKLRSKAEALRREAFDHSQKAAGMSQHQDYRRAQVEEDQTQKLTDQAADLEQQAIQRDNEATRLEQQVKELENRRNSLQQQVDALDKEIDQLQGHTTTIGGLFG